MCQPGLLPILVTGKMTFAYNNWKTKYLGLKLWAKTNFVVINYICKFHKDWTINFLFISENAVLSFEIPGPARVLQPILITLEFLWYELLRVQSWRQQLFTFWRRKSHFNTWNKIKNRRKAVEGYHRHCCSSLKDTGSLLDSTERGSSTRLTL